MTEITIKSVARKAGVSITTVSRVINGNYPVSAASKKRVENAMKDLNYRPNIIARNLRSNKTNLIAFVVADISNPFFMDAVKGLEGEVEQEGYNLVIASSNGSIEKEHKLIDSLIEQRIGGLVIASSDASGEGVKTCLEMNIPVVLIDRMIEGMDLNQVGWDNYAGAKLLTEKLIEKGHRRIGIVNVSLAHQSGTLRRDGFLDTLEEHGIPRVDEYVSPANFSMEEAYKWAGKLLGREKRPTALFCANNVMLEGALMAAGDASLSIGEELSLVSFGSIDFDRFLSTSITCLHQDSSLMGQKAGEILLRQLKGREEEKHTIVIPSEFREGDSIYDNR